jgi:dTMP kinase
MDWGDTESMSERGRYVVLEGGEGTGKSTQARELARRLDAHGVACRVVREPGGDPFAEAGRVLLLSDLDRTVQAETLMFNALRAQLLAAVVEPLLDDGVWVVSDRGRLSTIVYQGYGRRGDVAWVRDVCATVTAMCPPDLEIVLDVDPAVASARRQARGSTDRFERLGDAFHARVAAGYLAEARVLGLPTVDGTGDVDDVADRLWTALTSLGMIDGCTPAPPAQT